jgi:cell division protein FtsZ
MSINEFDFEVSKPDLSQPANIKLIGVGGGGSNAVEYMLNKEINGVDFFIANTDAQALNNSKVPNKIQLGTQQTKGLGAGANPDIGKKSAEEDLEKIKNILIGTDMLFITAGMGGGTGTGASSVIAEVAQSLGILTVAVVTLPFSHEGKKRTEIAELGIEKISPVVDSIITIPNDKLLSVLGNSVTLIDAFNAANEVLLGAVQGISNLIINPGIINVDFADVRTVMLKMGLAMMGSFTAAGNNRAREAAEKALSSPLLQDVNPSGAKGVLVNITASQNLSLGEFKEVGDTLKKLMVEDAIIVIGTVIDNNYEDNLKVTIIVTGLASGPEKIKKPIKGDNLIKKHIVYSKENINQSNNIDGLSYYDIPSYLRKKNDD